MTLAYIIQNIIKILHVFSAIYLVYETHNSSPGLSFVLLLDIDGVIRMNSPPMCLWVPGMAAFYKA